MINNLVRRISLKRWYFLQTEKSFSSSSSSSTSISLQEKTQEDKEYKKRVDEILVSTRTYTEGFEVVEDLGVVYSGKMESTNIFVDIMAAIGGIFGGESRDYTRLINQATGDALYRLKEEAADLGADGVLKVRFQTGTVMNRMVVGLHTSVLAYGTAVKFKKREKK